MAPRMIFLKKRYSQFTFHHGISFLNGKFLGGASSVKVTWLSFFMEELVSLCHIHCHPQGRRAACNIFQAYSIMNSFPQQSISQDAL